MQESIFSKSMKAGANTFFFDVKQSQKGKKSKYVQVSETWLQEGQPRRSTLTIFPDQLQSFAQAFQEVAEKAV